ncbi:MAG: signal peptidase I, partial [Candidatus Paceibacterota bacterium]
QKLEVSTFLYYNTPQMIRDTIKFVLLILLVVIPVRVFIAQPFIVNGASMDPTFEHGQYLIVDQISYRLEEPKRGDVIVFKYPNDQRQYFIKRVVALPGETIEINDDEVVVYNEKNPEGKVLNEPYLPGEKQISLQSIKKTELSDSEYFVMGDNRRESSDSRSWGPLNEELIIGRPLVRLLPPSSLSFLPGT